MSEALLFRLPVPGNGESPAVRITWSQSTDGSLWEEPIAVVLVADLPTDPTTGKLRWSVEEADPAKYHRLTTINESGDVALSGTVIAPRSLDGLQTLFGNIVELGGQAAPDHVIKVVACPPGQIVAGQVVSPAPRVALSGPTGSFSLPVEKTAIVRVTVTCPEGNTYFDKVITITTDTTKNLSTYQEAQ